MTESPLSGHLATDWLQARAEIKRGKGLAEHGFARQLEPLVEQCRVWRAEIGVEFQVTIVECRELGLHAEIVFLSRDIRAAQRCFNQKHLSTGLHLKLDIAPY